jgi:hypothetical protein
MSSKSRFAAHHGSPYLVQASPGFLESVPDPETPESLYEKQEQILKEELARLLGCLPRKESDAISLWIHGMSQAQIAERDGVTQAAISIRAKRGIEKLFELRDRGQLGTLKTIWDGLRRLRDHIDHEIDMERAADSDVQLPLGEDIGEVVGERFSVTPQENDDEPTPQGCDECRLPEPEHKLSCNRGVTRRKVKSPMPRSAGATLSVKEATVLKVIKSASATVHIKDIEVGARFTNLEVRNSLRRLVRNDLVKKLGKGMYAP